MGVLARARIATRTCDGRPLAAAGVNLKSDSDRLLPASTAARRLSPLAGVNEEIGSKLKEMGAGRFLLAVVVANAGVSTRPAAASATTSFASERLIALSKPRTPCSENGYSPMNLKVP